MFVASDIAGDPAVHPQGDRARRGRDRRGRAATATRSRPSTASRSSARSRQIAWDASLGREERLQALHAQGDLRAAQRRSRRRWPAASTSRATCSSPPSCKIEEIVLRAMTKISITGCGTAYHAGMVGMYLMRALCKHPGRDGAGVGVSLRRPRDGPAHADDRDVAVRRDRRHDRGGQDRARSRRAGHRRSATSSARTSRRIADGTLYTRGGPEISVAATKTYVSQAIAATLFALYLARVRKSAPLERLREIAEGTRLLPAAIDVVLNTSDEVKKIARKVRRGAHRCSSSGATSTSRPRSRARSSSRRSRTSTLRATRPAR